MYYNEPFNNKNTGVSLSNKRLFFILPDLKTQFKDFFNTIRSVNFKNGTVKFLLLSSLLIFGYNCNVVANEIDSVSRVHELKELTVRPYKRSYSKRNNPAVDLINLVRKNAPKGEPFNLPYYSFDKYSVLSIGLNHYADIPQDSSVRNFSFTEFIDSVPLLQTRVLKLSLKESFSKTLFRNKPHAFKTILLGRRNSGIDESFNQDNIFKSLEDILREVNIYDNNIAILQSRFVSPLSGLGPDYYKYFLTDTIDINGINCNSIVFTPRNPQTPGFSGILYIAANDTTGFIKRALFRIPSTSNVNYVGNMVFVQDYEKDDHGLRHKTSDEMVATLRLFDGSPEFIVTRITQYSNFSDSYQSEFTDYYSRTGHSFRIDGFDSQPDSFWEIHRSENLSMAEDNLKSLLPILRKKSWFLWSEKILKIIVNGYVGTSPKDSKFDIGPVNTLISFNSLEGYRFRLGGITTPKLSKYIFGKGYVAYGLRDKKFKYGAQLEFSFVPKRNHAKEFPVKSLSLEHTYDVDMIGQHYLFTNPDNVFLSFRRKKSELATYRRLSELTYTLELLNNFSFTSSVRYETQEESPFIKFINGFGDSFSSYNQAVLRIQLRYAPGEKFIQGHTSRQRINNDAAIFHISHEIGPKGWLGSEFFLNKTEISAYKRFWLSAFGYADITLKGGIIWNQVQFPTLLWANANLSYTVQQESYSLMNPMEFANDKFASVDLTYWMNGLILDRIPFVNKARLREIFTFKALWGGLSQKNNPIYNPELFQFPLSSQTYTMGREPYMEIGVGVDNILTILRLDYVWRLSYLNHPGINRHGLRISLHFSF